MSRLVTFSCFLLEDWVWHCAFESIYGTHGLDQILGVSSHRRQRSDHVVAGLAGLDSPALL